MASDMQQTSNAIVIQPVKIAHVRKYEDHTTSYVLAKRDKMDRYPGDSKNDAGVIYEEVRTTSYANGKVGSTSHQNAIVVIRTLVSSHFVTRSFGT
jgi:hypothetical protein